MKGVARSAKAAKPVPTKKPVPSRKRKTAASKPQPYSGSTAEPYSVGGAAATTSTTQEVGGGREPYRCWGMAPANVTQSHLDMLEYHDEIWGRPQTDTRSLFESQTLQLMQCGMQWKTVYDKRRGFGEVFKEWNWRAVAAIDDARELDELVAASPIRNRVKVNAVVNNARCIAALEDDFGEGAFARFLWQYRPASDDERLKTAKSVSGTHMRSEKVDKKEYKTRTKSDGVHPTKTVCELAAALKARGFKFMGETVVLSFMQAVGLVNHHDSKCWVFERNERENASTFPGGVVLGEAADGGGSGGGGGGAGAGAGGRGGGAAAGGTCSKKPGTKKATKKAAKTASAGGGSGGGGGGGRSNKRPKRR